MSVLTDNTAKLRKILEKVENLPEIPGNVAQATPSITVSSSGLITASATQEAGVVASGTKSATRQLTTKGGTTITPSDAVQTAVSAGTFVTGDILVAAVVASGAKVASGTVTSTSTSRFSIQLAFEPKAILIYSGASLSMTSRIKQFAMFGDKVLLVTYNNTFYADIDASSYSPKMSLDTFSVTIPTSGTYRSYQFESQAVYSWYAVG